MEWITAISQLLGSVAWPVTILILVLVFRKQVADRLNQPMAKLKIPGTEIEFAVNELESKLQTTTSEPSPTSGDTGDQLLYFASGDLQLSVARLRVGIENDLFRIAQIKGKSDAAKPFTINQRLNDLIESNALTLSFADNLRSFVDISNRIIHGVEIPDNVKGRATIIGASLAAQLEHLRKVIEMEREFDAHGLWHMHIHLPDDAKKYYWWSAVAAACPDFDYDYSVYREAAERHNNRLIQRMGGDRAKKGMVGVLPLSEFISVLEFRESELSRIAAAWEQGHEAMSAANNWQWPEEWGNIGWGGPVVRGLSFNEVERQLMQTRNALARYRTRNLDS